MTEEVKMEIAYFPGCTLKTKAIGLDDSVVDTAKAFGYDFHTNMLEKACDDQPCGRPEGYFFDTDPVKRTSEGLPMAWSCPDVKCMRAIKAEKVAEAVYEIVAKGGPKGKASQ